MIHPIVAAVFRLVTVMLRVTWPGSNNSNRTYRTYAKINQRRGFSRKIAKSTARSRSRETSVVLSHGSAPNSYEFRLLCPGGFSQVEVAMSALIAGVIITAALNLAGSASRGQVQNNDQLRARLIANSLMSEILELSFEDPNQTPAFGVEAGETTTPARRSLFDDIDDYHNWSSTPQTKTGSAIQDSQGLISTVQVKLADPGQLAAGATGNASAEVKQITVAVKRGTYVVSESVSVVTK